MNKMSLAPLLPSGAGYVELKQQENRSQVLAFLNGTLINNHSNSNSGIMARTFANGVWGLASSVDQSPASMEQVIRKALGNAELLSEKVVKGTKILPPSSAKGEYLHFTKKNPAGTSERIDFLKALDEYTIGKYPDLSTRQMAFSQLEMEKYIITSHGAELHTMTPRAILVVYLMILHDGVPLSHYDVFGGFGQYEDNFSDPSLYYTKIDEVYRQLTDKKDAVPPRGGTAECVLDADLAGILSHEAIGHTTEADFVINGSIAADYMSQPVASPMVTLVDVAHTWDGETCPVPVFIDDEGTPAQDCVIIENGILKRYMHNKESALIMGHELTGNARAYSYSDEPLIRMRNTIIVPGKDKLADMIASIEDGYYLVRTNNGQADSTSEFMFGVSLGYEIKHGKLGKAIRETTISGVAFDVLKTVSMISSDMRWSCAGMCGKKQQITVGMGGPAIKCKVNIGGK